MPSLVSTIVRGQIKLLSPLITGATLEQSRKSQDALGKLGTRALADKVHYKPLRFPHFDASWAIPMAGTVRKAVVYLHGGGYTAGGLDYAQAFGGLLAEQLGRAVLCVGYRLAPEDPFPAALNDALSSYRAALKRFAPEDIALVGESAGGGLCYSLALKLRKLGLPLPEKIVTISPWTDLTMSRDVDDLQKRDPLLDKENLQGFARMYAPGRDLAHPLISPLFGDLRGLPPSLMIVGDEEILLDDSVLMARRLQEAGCECRLHVAEGMWHVYVLYGVPEAKAALRMLHDFIQGVEPDNAES